MLLNYDFLEFENGKTENRTRDYSLTKAIDKELEAKRLAKRTRARVKVKEGLSLRATLDAFGDELSRLKNAKDTTIKSSTIEATSLGSILKKIQSGLPFGTISATRHFKDAFVKDFNETQRKLLMSAYKSGLTPSKNDKITKLYLAQVGGNTTQPIKVKDFFDPQGKVTTEYMMSVNGIYDILSKKLGLTYVDDFLDSKATMRDFMSSNKFVKRYRYTRKDNIKRTQELKSLLDKKRHFLGYLQVTGFWKENTNDAVLPDKEVSFFVFSHEPSLSFDLATELLLLGRHFDQEAICYCENAIVLKDDKYQVELVSTLPKYIGDVWATFDNITFSTPSQLPNALTRLQDQVYTFFEKNPEKDKYGVAFEDLVVKSKITAMKLPIGYGDGLGVSDYVKSSIEARQSGSRANGYQKLFFADEIENWERQGIFRREKLKCITSKSYRQSYNHNIKVRKLVNAMLKGKKVSRTLIAKVLANTIDTDAGYCFISPTDLATQLNNISPRVSKSIVTAIEQAEGVRLNYALIDKVTYNSLHNTLSFIFDIDNPLSDQSLDQLVVEVPREALKDVKLPQIKNVLTAQIFDGAYHFRGNDYKYQYQSSPELLDMFE
ncbi:hypothetical protein [Helicobacter pylori]|uniref:Uncharacterized protein n=1 Tax=Helicobacter pylori Aklavik86 TaxID=1055532 RepID=K7Z2D7_HELPX|nr:hypothetical protein [Helicobacter pylori]AFX90180.1 hypothetical protein HPAKL86_05955 [Helicobacter pylori Aklavik86]WQS23840.1 hypothetical protein KVD61_06065 [Helicobacter pylori]